MIRFLNDETVGGYRYGKGAIARFDVPTEDALVAAADAEVVDLNAAHPYYHFHGFAGNQTAGDSKFFDLSGINHGIRGANLSDATMFATAGYVSTPDPAEGTPDSAIRIPAINFDYEAGEKLIVWMLGKWTPEASAQALIGDGYSTTAGQRGWAIRVSTAGKVQAAVYGASSVFGATSTSTAFDGALHSFGLVLDGQNGQYCTWVDGAIDAQFGSGWAAFPGTGDTKTTNTVNLGTSAPAPGGTLGIASAIRACVIMRLPASYTTPDPSSFTAAFTQLRANPGKLILASAF